MTRTDGYTGDKPIHRRRFLIPDNYIQRNPSTDDIAREIDKIKTRLATEEGTERVFRTFPRPLVVTYDGTQQVLIDSASGAASRGLCASNFIRLAFTEYLSRKKNRKIISGLLTRETFVKIIDITRHYQRNRHLEVTNIIGAPFQPFVDDTDTQPMAGLPYFAWTLSTNGLGQNLKSLINLSRTEDSFLTVMQHLNNIASPIAGAVITASPEILSVLKLPLKSAPERKVFIVFDSNTYREYYPNGAGMVVFSSWQDAATFLARRLLKTEEESLDAGTIFNASFVVPRGSLTSSKANEILLEASMRILHLDAENSDLRDIIRIILSPDAPAPSPMQEQYQSRQPSGTEPNLDGATRNKLASLYSEIERLRSDNTEPQTKSVSMQDAPDSQARVERQAMEQQDRQQQQRQQQNQHDRAGETCRSTCLGTEEARRFKQTRRVMEEMRQTLEEEWRTTRKERQAMKEARRVMENERQATEAERLATKKERHAMEQAHLNFAQALRMANEASKYLANIAYHIDQTIRMAAAVAEQTRYGCSVVRRALGN